MSDYNGKKPVYQLWGELEFALDTQHLTWMGRFMYRTLLQKAWYGATKPDLPNDDAQLARLLGVPPDVWDQHEAEVRAMFSIDERTGVLYQKRLRADWEKLEGIRAKRALAGKKGGEHKSAADAVVLPAEIREVAKAVFAKCGKPPETEKIQRLLEKYPAKVIIGAFEDFYDNQYSNNDDRDAEKAEFVFFVRDNGGAGDIVCDVWSQQQQERN